MKQSPKLPAERRRAQLIKAASQVISRNGYVGATTDAIARKAGLTKGALYFHFGSKEDIFFEVVKSRSEKHLEIITGPLRNERIPIKALEKMICAAIELVEHRKYFNLEFWQQANKVRRVSQFLDQQHRKMEAELVTFLRKHYGLKKKDGHSLYILLHILFDGIVVRHECCQSRVDLEQLKKDVLKMTKLYLMGRQ